MKVITSFFALATLFSAAACSNQDHAPSNATAPNDGGSYGSTGVAAGQSAMGASDSYGNSGTGMGGTAMTGSTASGSGMAGSTSTSTDTSTSTIR